MSRTSSLAVEDDIATVAPTLTHAVCPGNWARFRAASNADKTYIYTLAESRGYEEEPRRKKNSSKFG